MNTPDSTNCRKQYTVNTRLVIITILGVVVVAPAIYFWHGMSIAKMSKTFLAKAESLVEEADDFEAVGDVLEANEALKKATDYIWQYRRIHPSDAFSAVLLATTYERSPAGKSNRERAAQLFVEAITRSAAEDSEESRSKILDLRLSAAELLLETGKFDEAVSMVEKASTDSNTIEKASIDSTLARITALANWGRVQSGNITLTDDRQVGESLIRGIQLNPENTIIPSILGLVLRDPELHKYLDASMSDELSKLGEQSYFNRADQVIDEMVERNPSNAEAYLARYQYQQSINDQPGLEDLEIAFELDEANAQVNFQLGERLLIDVREIRKKNSLENEVPEGNEKELVEQSLQHFENAIKLAPAMLSAYLLKGDAQRILGRFDDAVSTWNFVIQDDGTEYQIDPFYQAAFQERLIAAFISNGDMDKANEVINQMQDSVNSFARTTGNPRLLIELEQAKRFLRGLHLSKSGLYAESIRMLTEGLDSQGTRMDDRTSDFIRLLGATYMKLGIPSAAANTYAISVDRQSGVSEFSRDLINARIQARQLDQAITILSEIAFQTEDGNDLLQLADLYYQREATKPFESRDWIPFEQAIASASRKVDSIEEPWRLKTLRLRADIAKSTASATSNSNSEEPRIPEPLEQQLNELEETFDQDPEVLRTVILIRNRFGQSEKVNELLKSYVAAEGNTSRRFIFEAQIHVGKSQFSDAIKVLEEGTAIVDDSEKTRIQLANVGLHVTQGKFGDAVELLKGILEGNPDRPDLVIKLADLLSQIPDEISTEPQAWEEELNKLETQPGAFSTVLTIHRKLRQLDTADDTQAKLDILNECGRLCDSVIRNRIDWAVAYSLAGQIQHKRYDFLKQDLAVGDERGSLMEPFTNAKKSYEKALSLGEQRGSLIVKMLSLEEDLDKLTNDQKQLEESRAHKSRLLSMIKSDSIVENEQLALLKLRVLVGKNDFDAAEDLVDERTKVSPEDAISWVNKARFQLIRGSVDDAKKSAERAKILAPKSASPAVVWQRVFQFYASAKDFLPSNEDLKPWKDEAYEAINYILKDAPEENRTIVHASLLAEVGDDKAADYFIRAETANPNDINTLIRCRDYFGRVNLPDRNALDEAIRLAKKLYSINPDNANIRRGYYELLFRRGRADDWKMASSLLEDDNSATNGRYYALMLLYRKNVGTTKRISNLKKALEIANAGDKVPDHLLAGEILLAWIDVLDDEKDKDLIDEKAKAANEKFRLVSDSIDATKNQIYVAANFFLKRKEYAQVEFCIAKLEEREFTSAIQELPAVSLRAQTMLGQEKEIAEIIGYLDAYGEKVKKEVERLPKRTRSQVFQQMANVYDLVKATEKALAWRKRAVELDPNQRLRFALAQAKTGKTLEAIQVCADGFKESGLPAYVIGISEILISNDCDSEHYAIAEPVFADSLRKFPKSPLLLMSIANVRIAGQNNAEEAIRLYEQALQHDKTGNLLLLNNLATAYGEIQAKIPDAISTIDRAIRQYGNRPELLDTKAVILMQQGSLKEAETMLLDIVNGSSDPRYRWHLSEVKWKQYEKSKSESDLDDAKTQFRLSIERKLDQQVFTPSEKARLSELRKNLGVSGAMKTSSLPISGYKILDVA